jgi:Fe2+ or Zn2+ uptake regulation protein
LACERCDRVAEIEGEPVFAAIAHAVERAAFAPRRTVAEVSGECADCRDRQ